MYYVYILYSPNYDKFYVGQTQDLVTRLQYHNELAEKSFTTRYRPWEIQQSITVPDRSTAMAIERYVKRQKSRKYLKTLVEDKQAVARLKAHFSIGESEE